jgi:hypothetical protein
MVTIKSIDDFIKFKEFTTTPLCYVYYKESLLNAYYVGFTTQQGYYYLRNHHKMKKIKDIINNGFSIQIYTKYDEDTLIKLFKPKLNILKGRGICGRQINYVDLKHVGEVISMAKIKLSYKDKKREYHIQKSIYKKINKHIYSIYDTLWDNLFKNKNDFVSIHSDIIKYLIEKEKIKEENQTCIINNELFIKIFKYKDKSSILMNDLCSILKFCKITMLYECCILIHKIYLNNLNSVLEENNINKETLETNRNEWYNLFHSMNNYIKIYNKIIENLKSNNCFININKNNIKKIIIYSPYLYRLAIKEHFNLILQ